MAQERPQGQQQQQQRWGPGSGGCPNQAPGTAEDPVTPWSEQEIVEEWRAMRKIINAYQGYDSDSRAELRRQEHNYERLSEDHQRLLHHLPHKYQKWAECAEQNARFLNALLQSFQPPPIFQQLERQYGGESGGAPGAGEADDKSHLSKNGTRLRGVLGNVVAPSDREKVRCVLRSFARDWSEEGAQERRESYAPILQELQMHLPVAVSGKPPPRVIVPGAGLGRLANEIARLGYECQGNEFSYFMLIASNFILNFVERREQFSIHPWVHHSSNNLTDAQQMREVRIPDISPREGFDGDRGDGDTASEALPSMDRFSMCAGDFVEVYSCRGHQGQWDGVVSCFFIDTAHNVIEYMQVIYNVLRPGGVWINLGPLLYHWAESVEDELSIELSLEDVLNAAQAIGFVELRKEEDKPCTYTSNYCSMMQTVYRCAFFTLQKPQVQPPAT